MAPQRKRGRGWKVLLVVCLSLLALFILIGALSDHSSKPKPGAHSQAQQGNGQSHSQAKPSTHLHRHHRSHHGAAGPAAVAAGCHARDHGKLPDRNCTPGAVNPNVTQANIASTICMSGWTETVRPDESYTDALKIKQIGQYHFADTSTSDYEEDHLIPLELARALQ